MKIDKTITVTITPEELKKIITEYLKSQNILDTQSVYFNVSGHEDPSDWQGSLPLSYTLDGVVCKGNEIR